MAKETDAGATNSPVTQLEVSGKSGKFKLSTPSVLVATIAVALVGIALVVAATTGWVSTLRQSSPTNAQQARVASGAIGDAPLQASAPKPEDADQIMQSSTGNDSPNLVVVSKLTASTSRRKIEQHSTGSNSKNLVEHR